MQNALSNIVKRALEVKCKDFIQTVEEATRLLREENGIIGNFQAVGRLARVNPVGKALVIGDLHGDLESLIDILKQSDFMHEMNRDSNALLVFLGDYGDRGEYSAEIYHTVLELKLLYPEQVILMRGNHEQFWVQEGKDDLGPSPHDLPVRFQARFGPQWNEAYLQIRRMFIFLYNAVLVEERYLMIHGGIPWQARTIDDLALAHVEHLRQAILEDMLWSDPDETINGIHPSPRGAGKLFGKEITDEVLRRFKAKILIRGHEPCEEGYKINHNGKVLTLFSRKGPPYFNTHGAYLVIELSKTVENAEQLVPHIHKF